VLGVETNGTTHTNERAVYTADYIRQRARMIGYGIDARSQRFPNETSFIYKPHAEVNEVWRWSDAVRPSIHDYNRQDLSI
ncbi:MAG: hypothetical protein VW339_13715, partial [Quisquiliibacterium sp.]